MLYPLVRTRRVLPSGLTRLVTACPARYCGLSAKPGFNGTNAAPAGAVGVICWPLLGMDLLSVRDQCQNKKRKVPQPMERSH